MRWNAIACTLLMVGCAGGPPLDNPSAPGSFRPGVDQKREAQALQLAETECAAQGKHAVARREEGETFYDCVDR
jgi:hypothetical protein